MILDRLDQHARYEAWMPELTAAFAFLQRPDAAQLPDGRHEIDGDRAFAMVSHYATRDPAAIRNLLGLDYKRLLHGEQGFSYHRMAYAGDRLRFEQRIEDIYDKKGGALEFVLRRTRVTNQRGEHVADLRSVTVMRNG